MGLKSRRALVQAKLETTYGINPNPTAAVNAMLCNVTTPRPVVATSVDRNNIQAFMGQQGSVQVSANSAFELEVEAQSSGTPGLPPAYSVLLRACGMAETIVEDESVMYTPVSDGFESVTLAFNLDGKNHVMTGCRGTLTYDGTPGQIAKWRFSLTGLESTVTDLPLASTANYGAFLTPLAVNKQNTTMELFGVVVPVHAFTLDLAQAVAYKNVINQEDVDINSRASTGSVTHDNTLVAVKDWEGMAKAGTLGELTFQHGKTAGQIVEIFLPNVQYSEPQSGDTNGTATLQATLRVKPLQGNDEIQITFR